MIGISYHIINRLSATGFALCDEQPGCPRSRFSPSITIRVTGNGFLYNMVRIIAGTLVQVGGGAIEPEAVKGILAKKDRSAAGPTAPAHGLTMMGIEFENVE